MKKVILIILSVMLCCFLMTVLTSAKTQGVGNISPKKVSVEETKLPVKRVYRKKRDKLQDIMNASDVIVVGEVVGANAVDFTGDVFTDYDIRLEQTLKNSRNYDLTDMEIRFTGGTSKTNETYVEETPVLELGKTYLFTVKKTFPKDDTKKEFTPSGAYQGVFELEVTEENGKADYKICRMNSHNAVEDDAQGRLLSALDFAMEYHLPNIVERAAAKVEYIEQSNKLQDIMDASDVIVVGQVVGANAVDFAGCVFTDYDIRLEQNLKNSRNYDLTDMEIRFTGGKSKTNIDCVQETPVLKLGKTYLFTVKKTFPDDDTKKEFSPLGAYQGVFELEPINENGKFDYRICRINPFNAVEDDAQGRLLSEIKNSL